MAVINENSLRVILPALGRRGRGLVLAGLLAGGTAVTLSHLYNPMSVFPLISAYVSVFFMLWLAVTDAVRFVLPNKILLLWLACRVIFILLTVVTDAAVDEALMSLGGALVAGILFLLTHYVSKRTLGGGDVKTSFVMGLALTLSMVLNALFYGVVCCSVFALLGLAFKKLKRKDAVPLGPFLYAGMLIAFLVRMGG